MFRKMNKIFLLFILVSNASFASVATPRASVKKHFLVLSSMDVTKYLSDEIEPVYIVTDEQASYLSDLFSRGIPHCIIREKLIEEYERCARELEGRVHRIDFVYSGGSETAVVRAGHMRDFLGLKNGMGEEQALLFADKLKMKRTLLEHAPDVKTSKFTTLNETTHKDLDVLKGLELPLVFKPALTDGGALGVEIFKTRDEVDKFMANYRAADLKLEYIVEEFIEGEPVRIDGHVEEGVVQAIFPASFNPSCYDYYTKGKSMVKVSDSHNPAMLAKYHEFTSKVIRTLKLPQGAFHLEAFKKPNGDLYFIEIAARPGGGTQCIYDTYGYDIGEAHVASDLGRTYRPALKNTDKAFGCLACPGPGPRNGVPTTAFVKELSFRGGDKVAPTFVEDLERTPPGFGYDITNGNCDVLRRLYIGDPEDVLRDAKRDLENLTLVFSLEVPGNGGSLGEVVSHTPKD